MEYKSATHANLLPILTTSQDIMERIPLTADSAQELHWQEIDRKPFGIHATVQHLQLYFGSIEVYGSDAKILLEGSTRRWMSASVPKLWMQPAHALAIRLNSESVEEKLKATDSSLSFLSTPQTVYVVKDGNTLEPAYSFLVTHTDALHALRMVASAISGDILEFIPLSFDFEDDALMYRENAVASSQEGRVVVTLKNLTTAGRLEHALFRVKNCLSNGISSDCVQTAEADENQFEDIPYESNSYDELVAYNAIQRSLDWYRKFEPASDFNLSGAKALQVYVRTKVITEDGKVDLGNAAYHPAAGPNNAPYIEVGPGYDTEHVAREGGLVNLGKDSDVVMHEFGHHMVFRSLTRGGPYAGDAGAMHEGFADFFTYAITGNNKLAESVIPGKTSLRAGNKTDFIQDALQKFTKKGVHQLGELWSSALWDARTKLGYWRDGLFRLDKIVWDSIDLLNSNATYYDAIAALAKSAERFAAENNDDPVTLKEMIFSAFSSRHYLAQPSGDGTLPPSLLDDGKQRLDSPASPAAPVSVSQPKDTGGCGVIASSQYSSNKVLIFLILLPIAILTAKPSSRRTCKARSRTKNKVTDEIF